MAEHLITHLKEKSKMDRSDCITTIELLQTVYGDIKKEDVDHLVHHAQEGAFASPLELIKATIDALS